MNKTIIWHNTGCSTSCHTLDILKKRKIIPERFLYLQEKITKKDLKRVLKMLGIKAVDLVRKKERLYKEEFEGKKLKNEQWIEVLIKHPVLIERPIVIHGDRAVLGRPPEKVLEIFKP